MRDAGRTIVGRDLPCVRCGYNLRGLSHADQCPECNTLVTASLMRQGFLRFVTHAAPLIESDPRWVRSIVGGMGWLAAVIGLQFVTPFVMEYGFDPRTRLIVRAMLATAGWIAFIAGVMKVTRLDAGTHDRDVWTVRLTAGVAALAAFAMPALRSPLTNLFTIICGISTALTIMLLHVHLGTLAARLPSRALRVVATVGGFALPVVGFVLAVAAPGPFEGPRTFGPVDAVARFALPGGIDAMLARPGQSLLKLCLVASGCTPLYFLAIWYARPRAARLSA